MWKAGDFKVCLSSIEFSVFYQQPSVKCCPSCGYFFPPETLSDVTSRYFRESYFRLSSLILVLGVGSWLYFKLMKKREQKIKPKKPLVSCSRLTFKDQMIFNKIYKMFNYRESSSSSKSATAAAAAPAIFSNLNNHSNLKNVSINSLGLPVSEDITYTVSYSDSDEDMSDYYIDENDVTYTNSTGQYSNLKRSHSISSQSGEIGSGTIAKLDQLLQQIDDIKESVGEMNSDLFNVHSYDHNLVLLSDFSDVDDESLLRLNGHSCEDLTIEFLAEKEDPQTPSLEWDSNDIDLFAELSKYPGNNTQASIVSSSQNSALVTVSTAINQNTLSQTSSLSSSIINANSKSTNLPKSFGPSRVNSVILDSLPASSSLVNLNMDTSLTNYTVETMSSSCISSIDGSLLSSPDQERVRFESINDLINEARRLGLLNDLVLFLKNSKRDSAYFEE